MVGTKVDDMNSGKLNTNIIIIAPMSKLPEELLIIIFGFLEIKELALTVSRICKNWKRVAEDESLWKSLYFYNWKKLANSTKSKLAESETRRKNFWRKLVSEKQKLVSHWMNGKYTISTIPAGSAITCLQFDHSGKLLSGSADGTIMVWNCDTKQRLLPLHGHSGPVWTLQFDDSKVISGSYDKTIKIWNFQSGKCIETLRGHRSMVSHLQFKEDTLLSGSWDKSIRVWKNQYNDDICHYECVSSIDQQDCVFCLQFDFDKILSGGANPDLVHYDYETHRIIKKMSGHTQKIYCLSFEENLVVSGSSDKTIRLFDLRTGKNELTLEGHDRAVMTLQTQFDEKKIISGSMDKSIKIWDFRRHNKAMKTLQGHGDDVLCLQFNETMLVSGGNDRCIQIYQI